MQARRQVCRPKRKLLPGGERFELVAHMLRERLSPEQIAGKLRSMNIPSLREAYVCRETIYGAARVKAGYTATINATTAVRMVRRRPTRSE